MAFSFTYGGVRSEDVGLIVNNVRRDIIPPASARMIPIPNRAGQHYHRSDYEVRMIEVDVTIVGMDLNNVREITNDIADFLDVSDGLKELIFDDEDDFFYMAVVDGSTSLNQIIKFQQGTISFLVPNSFKDSVVEIEEDLLSGEMDRDSTAYYLENPMIEVDQRIGRFLPSRYGKGLLIEEGTNNILSENVSSVENSTSGFFTVVGEGITINRSDDFSVHGDHSLEVLTFTGDVNRESDFSFFASVTPEMMYTFSVFMLTELFGTVVVIRVFETTNGNNLLFESSPFMINEVNVEQIFFTFNIPSGVSNISIGILSEVNTGIRYYCDCFQFEQKPYITSWQLGDQARIRERMVIDVSDGEIFKSDEGTLELIFERYVTPTTSIGTFVDFGNTGTDRFRLLHGEGFGSGLDQFNFNYMSNGGANNTFLSVNLSNQTVIGNSYYVALRWLITGDSSGYLKIDVYDVENDEHVSNMVATSQIPADFSSFINFLIGCNLAGTQFGNSIYNQVVFSDVARIDDDIEDRVDRVRNNVREVLDDHTTAIYTCDDHLGRMMKIEGNTRQFPLIEFVIDEVVSSVKCIHVESGRFIEILNPEVSEHPYVIDNLNRTVTVNGLSVMDKVSLGSRFFVLDSGDNTIYIDHGIDQKIKYRTRFL